MPSTSSRCEPSRASRKASSSLVERSAQCRSSSTTSSGAAAAASRTAPATASNTCRRPESPSPPVGRGASGAHGQQPVQHRPQRGARPVQRAEHLGEGQVGECGAALVQAPPDDDLHARLRGGPAERGGEPGLSDPRLPGEQHGAGLPGPGRVEVAEQPESSSARPTSSSVSGPVGPPPWVAAAVMERIVARDTDTPGPTTAGSPGRVAQPRVPARTGCGALPRCGPGAAPGPPRERRGPGRPGGPSRPPGGGEPGTQPQPQPSHRRRAGRAAQQPRRAVPVRLLPQPGLPLLARATRGSIGMCVISMVTTLRLRGPPGHRAITPSRGPRGVRGKGSPQSRPVGGGSRPRR